MRNDALNAVCPYYTMYPLDFPLGILERFGKRGDWVIDPFCGRGTTNFAARLRKMPSIGVDSSPVATAVAQAKLATATLATSANAPKGVGIGLVFKFPHSADAKLVALAIDDDVVWSPVGAPDA